MSNPARIFHFHRIRQEYQEQVYAMPTVLKSRERMGVRHGLLVEDMAIGDTTVFDTALANQVLNPIPIEQVGSIHIRESDPEYFWLTLNMGWNQLED